MRFDYGPENGQGTAGEGKNGAKGNQPPPQSQFQRRHESRHASGKDLNTLHVRVAVKANRCSVRKEEGRDTFHEGRVAPGLGDVQKQVSTK